MWTTPAPTWRQFSFFGFFASAWFCSCGNCRYYGGEEIGCIGSVVVHRKDDDFSYCGVLCQTDGQGAKALDESTRTKLEAAVFRRLVKHLQERTDVQNIDMMILAGFCRNCLGDWFREAAAEQQIALEKDEARAIVYGMPSEEWKSRYQKEATVEQKAAFAKAQKSS